VNKKKYSIPELIRNQSFRRLVKGTASHEEVKKWDKWVEESEVNREKAKIAMAEIVGFQFSDPQLSDVEGEWKKLYKKTVGKSKFSVFSAKKTRNDSAIKWLFRVAAVLVLGAMIGLGFYIYSPEKQSDIRLVQISEEKTISTEDGVQKTVRFSNGSKIDLKSNSEITYSVSQDPQQVIKVFLKGEAFFDAESNPESTKPFFAVHTPDGVIRDIGTEFIVTVHRDRSRIVLQEGKVQISTNKKSETDEISMAAGELLEFNQSKVLNKQKVNASFYTSWATGFLELNQTSIQDFAKFVEQRFDVHVIIENPKIVNIKIDGGIYYRSLAELVRSVTEVADIPVYRSKDRDTVYIGENTINQSSIIKKQ
jgi:ferric-dicitrate binding protein FerR (iron transport regulator)